MAQRALPNPYADYDKSLATGYFDAAGRVSGAAVTGLGEGGSGWRLSLCPGRPPSPSSARPRARRWLRGEAPQAGGCPGGVPRVGFLKQQQKISGLSGLFLKQNKRFRGDLGDCVLYRGAVWQGVAAGEGMWCRGPHVPVVR